MASPGENVSFAVKMGTILIPEPGFDHFESLEDKDGVRWVACQGQYGGQRTLSQPWLVLREIGKQQISLELQPMQDFRTSSPTAGHYRSGEDTVYIDQSCGGQDKYPPHTGFTRGKRPESFVETVCQNYSLQDLFVFVDQLLLACGRFWAHVGPSL